MKFTLTIPDPATRKVGKEDYFTLKSGTELHRIHRTAYQAVQFNGTDQGSARFSPIRAVTGQIIPTIYGAQSFACAACEIILRCPDTGKTALATGRPSLQIVYPGDYQEHSHSIIKTAADLKLLDLTIKGQRKIGINANALLAGPRSTYQATRGWAEALHDACKQAQGLYYTSVQYGPDFAVVLFGDRVPDNNLISISTRKVADEPCHTEIGKLADSLSIDYEDV